MYINTGRIVERFAAHGCCNHANRDVCRALERRAATQVDDVLAALDDALLKCVPVLNGHLRADELRQGLAGNHRRRCEYGHLLAVAAVRTAVLHLVGRNLEVLGQLRTQTRRVKSGEGGHLRGLQTRVNQGNETRDVGRVEDNDHVLYIGAVGLEVLTEILGNLSVALEQVLTRHAGLAGCTARRYDIGSARKSLLHVGRPGDVYTLEGAVVELLGNTFQCRTEGVIEANVRRKAHHQSRLCHVRTNHAGCADDGQFLVRQKFHNRSVLKVEHLFFVKRLSFLFSIIPASRPGLRIAGHSRQNFSYRGDPGRPFGSPKPAPPRGPGVSPPCGPAPTPPRGGSSARGRWSARRHTPTRRRSRCPGRWPSPSAPRTA